ncbi:MULTISPECIES: TVP38/TMEM64 family protein [Bacillaceae]|uniref:TVP38/TMEM64 family membrane protein n=1 Tax=Evansella alkalicola TaxID=745819 RepID=A0ABS6JS45_9BACI|nr:MULTISPECIES: VTT domain-containing protein [Bacillaceae]MBU9721391.1 VTT domain-containing protein [Bacillus alkalicola]
MKKFGVLLIVGFILFIIFIDWDVIKIFMEQDIEYFTSGALLDELGYGLLWVTLPLMIIQGVVTLFPILIIILLHFVSFGLTWGFLFSLIGAIIGALVCYWLTDTLSSKWVDRFWGKREKTLNKILGWIHKYGVLVIVVLRSIPVMPSNLISIAAALSPVTSLQYFWSTILGNISMVWILSLLAAPLWISDSYFLPYLIGYIIYCIAVAGYYSIQFFQTKSRKYAGDS